MAEQAPTNPTKKVSWLRRLAWLFGLGFAIYLIAGFFLVPYVVKSQIVALVEAQIGITPTVERVRYNPLSLRLEIDGFDLSEPGEPGPVLAFEAFVADLDGPGFLFADVGIDEIRFVRPVVSAVIEESGELNFMRLLASGPVDTEAEVEGKTEPAAETDERGAEADADADSVAGGLPVIDVASIRIEGGTFVFSDRAGLTSFDVTVVPVDLEIDGFTTRVASPAPYVLGLKVGEETELRWVGSVGADPIESTGHVELEGLDLRLPWDWASERLRFEIREGRLGLTADYTFSMADDLSLSIEEASLRLEQLRLIDGGDESEVLSLPRLDVTGIGVEVDARGLGRVAVETIAAGPGGRLVARLESEGGLQLVDLFTPIDDGSEEAVAVDEVAEEPAPNESAAPLEISLERASLEGFEIDFEDRTTPRPVVLRVSPLDLEITGYRSAPGTSVGIRLAAGLGEGGDGGQLTIEGPIRIEPLEATLSVVAESVGLAGFQPYLEDIARMDVKSGSLSSDLELGLATKAGGEGADITAKGALSINDLRLQDRALQRDFLSWGALRLDGIDFAPERLQLAALTLSGAFTEIVLGPGEGSNLETIFGSDEDATEADSEGGTDGDGSEAPPFALAIDRISLEASRARFEDLSSKPGFSIALEELGGTIQGLSSQPDSRARVSLDGRIDGAAPLRVSGEINPLIPDPYADLEIAAEGISLPPFSTYTRRYVGYPIDRGKLDLDLDYELEANRLDAGNHFVLRRVAFGDKVDSASALSLPIPLALAMMRDGSGRVDLRIPVKGNLDDPGFSVLGVVGKTFVNIIMKAATSPLALIPMPSGGDPSRVPFAPGSDAIESDEEATLQGIASVLAEKPELVLEIQGRADASLDGDVLRRALLDEELRRVAYEELTARERRRAGQLERFEPDEAQRLRALERLHAARVGSRADEIADPAAGSTEGQAGDSIPERASSPAATLMDALLATVELGEDALSSLARSRAARVQAILLADERVEAGRVFMREVEVGETASEGLIPTRLSLATQ